MNDCGVIHTERCILNHPEAGDREDVFRLRTDPDVRRFLGGPAEVATFDYRFSHILESDSDRYWAVRAGADRAFIGLVSLDPYHNDVDTEVSYEFLPEYWGKGFATESVGAVISFALKNLGLDRIVAETQAANLPSRRLLERLGMRMIGSVDRFGEEQAIYSTSDS